MAGYPILNLCSRVTGHSEQHLRLLKLCSTFSDWDMLLRQSEMEGMTPLLNKHLRESGFILPVSLRRSLSILVRHHDLQALVIAQTLREVLERFNNEGLTPIVIKGAALCHTVYPDPGLRPMRDIDILMREKETIPAMNILKKIGFQQSHAPIPTDHFHLPAMLKKNRGFTICIEIHHGLYPNCPPYYSSTSFETLLKNSKRFVAGDISALTFGDEDMLWYLYQHGFRAPLTYESYKLINAADIISLTEASYSCLNWQNIHKKYTELIKVLPLMHHITPWNPEIIPREFVSEKERAQLRKTTPFQGWPKKKIREQKMAGQKIHNILFATFFPSSWWLKVYYGLGTGREFLWCIVIRHPRHIFWWIRLYSSYLLSSTADAEDNAQNSLLAVIALGVKNGLRKTIILIQKLR
jgi:hypothetical protein